MSEQELKSCIQYIELTFHRVSISLWCHLTPHVRYFSLNCPSSINRFFTLYSPPQHLQVLGCFPWELRFWNSQPIYFLSLSRTTTSQSPALYPPRSVIQKAASVCCITQSCVWLSTPAGLFCILRCTISKTTVCSHWYAQTATILLVKCCKCEMHVNKETWVSLISSPLLSIYTFGWF